MVSIPFTCPCGPCEDLLTNSCFELNGIDSRDDSEWWKSWGAKTQAVPICGAKTGGGDSSSANGGMKVKFSGYFRQVKCQKVIEKFFQQMLFFGQIRPKCGSFLRQVPPKISKKIEFSVSISAVCDNIWGGFFPRSLWDLISTQKSFFDGQKLFCP